MEDKLNTNISQPSLRVAILRSDEPHNEYSAALLQNAFDVVAMVVEPGTEQRRLLRLRRRWRDWAYALYHHARRAILGFNAYRRRYFADAPQVLPNRRAPTMRVSSVNEPRVRDFLQKAKADVTVVTCTTILRPETIEAAGEAILNIHGGHLPHYRGCHCFFFALWDGAFDRIGSTIHFVDEGIDTGDIVEVVRPAIRPHSNAESLYCRAEKLAAQRLVVLLRGLEEGVPLPRTPQPFKGRLCLRRDRKPHHELVFWLRRKLGRIALPVVEDFECWNHPATAPGGRVETTGKSGIVE